MSQLVKLKIARGKITLIYADEHAAFMDIAGKPTTTRASFVEPDTLGTGWSVDLSPVGGPRRVGPFPLRQQALDEEAAYLDRTLF